MNKEVKELVEKDFGLLVGRGLGLVMTGDGDTALVYANAATLLRDHLNISEG